MASHFIIVFSFLIVIFSTSLAFDPSPLQDLCVADYTSSVLVNGFTCKDPKSVQANDFYMSGLHLPGNTSNPMESKVSPVSVFQIPGLNTLGITLARIDLAPSGVNPLHFHLRGTEILIVLEGTLEVGFVTSSPNYRLITKVLQKGDVFVFPLALVHYQKNIGNVNAVAIAALNSQFPGFTYVANGVFGTKPPISADLLAKSFQTNTNTIESIRSQF